MPSELSPRQADVLRFIVEYHRAHATYPTIREMCKELRIVSPNGIMSHLRPLEKKGYIRFGGAKARNVVVRKLPAEYLRLPALFVTDEEGWKLLHELRAELEARRAERERVEEAVLA